MFDKFFYLDNYKFKENDLHFFFLHIYLFLRLTMSLFRNCSVLCVRLECQKKRKT